MKSLGPIILILVSVGVFFFFIDPQYKEVQALQEQKAEYDQLLEKAKQLRSAREELNSRYESFSDSELETLEKVLPDTVDNIRLIVDMNDIAEDYGIVIRNIGVSGGPLQEDESGQNRTTASRNSGTKYGTITLNFSVTTTYDIFKQFMMDLENSMRLLDIKDFSVSAGDGEFYTYSLTLDTYWLR